MAHLVDDTYPVSNIPVLYIRNEMTVITGFAEEIQEGTTTNVKESARQITEQANRLLEQTNHERDLIKILTSSREGNPTSIDVDDVLRHRVTELREEYPTSDVTISSADEFTLKVLPEIGQAIKELVENAIQHNDTGSPIVDIELVRHSEEKVALRVTDNGPGIPEKERDSLLLDHEIDQISHSSGLGLVFVYWVVRLSGGEISFEENHPGAASLRLFSRSVTKWADLSRSTPDILGLSTDARMGGDSVL